MTPPVEDISLETGATILLVICCCCWCTDCKFDPPWVGKTTVSPTAKIADDDSIVISDIDWDGEGIEDDDSFDAATLIEFFLEIFLFQNCFLFCFFFLLSRIYKFICCAADVIRIHYSSKMDALCYSEHYCETYDIRNCFLFILEINSVTLHCTNIETIFLSIIYWCKQKRETISNGKMIGIFFRRFDGKYFQRIITTVIPLRMLCLSPNHIILSTIHFTSFTRTIIW